jgi:hypothetical protein
MPTLNVLGLYMMDKSLLIFVAIGVGFLYFVTSFIGDLQKDDDTYANSEYNSKHQYDQYMKSDAIGEKILDVTDVDENTQLAAWQESSLKKEFLDFFPDFGEMKSFIKNRTRGALLQKKVLSIIDEVEGGYLSGTLNSEHAKRKLDLLN